MWQRDVPMHMYNLLHLLPESGEVELIINLFTTGASPSPAVAEDLADHGALGSVSHSDWSWLSSFLTSRPAILNLF